MRFLLITFHNFNKVVFIYFNFFGTQVKTLGYLNLSIMICVFRRLAVSP